MFRINTPIRILLGAGVLALPLSMTTAATSASYTAALASLKAAGFQSVEELETTADGGFEAEVFDAQQQAFDVRLDSSGTIKNQRADADEGPDESIEMQVMEQVVAWIEAQGYRNTSSISADDGHIEVETQDAKGAHVELDVEATADGVRVLRTKSDAGVVGKVKEWVD